MFIDPEHLDTIESSLWHYWNTSTSPLMLNATLVSDWAHANGLRLVIKTSVLDVDSLRLHIFEKSILAKLLPNSALFETTKRCLVRWYHWSVNRYRTAFNG